LSGLLGEDLSGPSWVLCTCKDCQRRAPESDRTSLPGRNPLDDARNSVEVTVLQRVGRYPRRLDLGDLFLRVRRVDTHRVQVMAKLTVHGMDGMKYGYARIGTDGTRRQPCSLPHSNAPGVRASSRARASRELPPSALPFRVASRHSGPVMRPLLIQCKETDEDG
jgi:hypothetical protein